MSPNLRVITADSEAKEAKSRWRPKRHHVIGVSMALGALAGLVWHLATMNEQSRDWAITGLVLVSMAVGWIALRNWLARVSLPPGAQVVYHIHRRG